MVNDEQTTDPFEPENKLAEPVHEQWHDMKFKRENNDDDDGESDR
jgi:hypothetical protein